LVNTNNTQKSLILSLTVYIMKVSWFLTKLLNKAALQQYIGITFKQFLMYCRL